jgi:hypothetical protein
MPLKVDSVRVPQKSRPITGLKGFAANTKLTLRRMRGIFPFCIVASLCFGFMMQFRSMNFGIAPMKSFEQTGIHGAKVLQ